MSDTIRIRLSAGLLVVAVLHAVLLAAAFEWLHRPHGRSIIGIGTAPVTPISAADRSEEPLPNPQTVNLRAQTEMKQQCVPCQTTATTPRPTPATSAPPSVLARPEPSPAVTPVKNYQLALFVGSDATSQQLLEWFNQDSRLQAMRKTCEFQVYTASSPLYQSRFAKDIPVDQFPVVLLQDKLGGHIHAAGKSMIPATVDALYADFRKGFELYQQARQAQKTGAIKSRGYSWDAAISPTMQLQPGDCPDGFCPDSGSSDRWTPGERLRDLFDQRPLPRDALLWTSASEIATIVLVVAAVVLLSVIVWKRM